MHQQITSTPAPPQGYKPALPFEYPRLGLQVMAISLVIITLPLLFWLTWVLQGQTPVFRFGLLELVIVLLTIATTVVLHELIHGLTYSLLGYKVSYGANLRLMAAYAAAFGQWQARGHNVIVALAPLLGLNGLFILLLTIPQPTLTLIAFSALLFNTSGAVGDLYLVWRLWRTPARTLLYDIDVKTMLIYEPVDS